MFGLKVAAGMHASGRRDQEYGRHRLEVEAFCEAAEVDPGAAHTVGQPARRDIVPQQAAREAAGDERGVKAGSKRHEQQQRMPSSPATGVKSKFDLLERGAKPCAYLQL